MCPGGLEGSPVNHQLIKNSRKSFSFYNYFSTLSKRYRFDAHDTKIVSMMLSPVVHV